MRSFSEIMHPVCLCSAEIPNEIHDKLSDRFHVITLPPDNMLAKPVRCHPDMICSIVDKNIIFPTNYAEKNLNVIDEIKLVSGYSVILTDSLRGENYPLDVGLNSAIGCDFIICRKKSTDSKLLEIANNSGKYVLNVSQGYAGCSCIVANNSVLTSDKGIFNILMRENIDVELCDNTGIVLPGYDVGFIGGCGGYFDGSIYFFGNFDLLECASAIREFAAKHSLDICKLSNAPLTDYGGLKFLP